MGWQHFLAAVVLFAGCGPIEYDVLFHRQQVNDHTYDCPDGSTVLVNDELAETRKVSETCLGIRCFSEATGTDDPQCSDAALNKLAGTCVEQFFSCFDAGGACMDVGEDTTWANGARRIGDAYYPPNADEPCIVRSMGEPGIAISEGFGLIR